MRSPLRAVTDCSKVCAGISGYFLPMTTIPKPPITKVAIYQLAALLPTSVSASFVGYRAGLFSVSRRVGTDSPHAWFARQAYKYSGAKQAPLVVRAMYRGETGKVVLTATLMAVLFALHKQWNYLALFTAFIAMIPLQLIFTRRALHNP